MVSHPQHTPCPSPLSCAPLPHACCTPPPPTWHASRASIVAVAAVLSIEATRHRTPGLRHPVYPVPLDGAFPCHARQPTCHPLIDPSCRTCLGKPASQPASLQCTDRSTSQPVREWSRGAERAVHCCMWTRCRTVCRACALDDHSILKLCIRSDPCALVGCPAEPRDCAASAARLLVRWIRTLACGRSLVAVAAHGGAVRGSASRYRSSIHSSQTRLQA